MNEVKSSDVMFVMALILSIGGAVGVILSTSALAAFHLGILWSILITSAVALVLGAILIGSD